MKRYVIVGGGPAGVNAAVSIRSRDPEGMVVVLDRDHDLPYYRTELDTYIGGSTPETELPLNPAAFYQDQRIELRLGTVVAQVRPSDRVVGLADGGQVEYDRLLLAPGSKPVTGAWPGSDLDGMLTVRTWDDAREVIRRVDETDHGVIVVGGGVLGLILADGISQRAKRVTLLEREARLWVPFLDSDASDLVARALQQAGVEVWLGEEIAEAYGEHGRLTGIRTSKARTMETSLAVVAIGVRPDLQSLEGSEIRLDRGILIDHEFRTSIRDIFAAGDATQGYDPVSGMYRVVTNWKNAVEQGRLAGESMAGAPTAYKGVVVANSEAFFGLRVSVLGVTQPLAKGTVVLTGRDDSKGLYRKLILRQDKLIGTLLVGNVSGEGMMRKAIIDGKPMTVDEAKSKFLTGLILEEGVVS